MLRAGARLLAAKGYEATSLIEIVDAAGASRGSIYFHFPGGKQQLALEALRLSTDRVLERAARAIQAGDDTAAALRLTASILGQGLEASDFEMGCPIATVALETANTDPEIRAFSAAFFERWRSLYVGSLLRDGFDPARAARLAAVIVSVIEGGLLLARAAQQTKPLDDACGEAAALIASAQPG